MAHNDDDNNSPPYVPVPPETYNYLVHALLSNPHYSNPTTTLPPPTPIPGPSSVPPVPFPPRAGPSQPAPSPTALSATTSTAQEPDGPEDAGSVAEDKRRRNTAASARFRIKKKLKTLNLERTVNDLSGRTEELEREATDLRRENTWLKEIVLLKGRNLVASNAAAPTDRQDESDPKSSGKGKDKAC